MTEITIQNDQFFLDGVPTYAGRTWKGHRIEGLLLNTRMVQATFDDENLETRQRWAYPDTGLFDAERNVTEFLAALPTYRDHGVLAVTVNFQGGSPEGYSKEQPWSNTAFTAEGEFKPAYLDRMRRVLDRLDELGMVAILGVFYFGQDERLADEAAVIRALDNTVRWVLAQGYRHVLLEVNNECNVKKYEHEILQPHRIHELIERAKSITVDGRRLLVGTSYGGNFVPLENVVRTSDFLLLHGNGVSDPNRIAEMVEQTRQVPGYRPMPILFNEDDHFHFDQDWNNFVAAISRYASWGYFDPGANDYADGYQSPPVNWGLNTERKRDFFVLAREISGIEGRSAIEPLMSIPEILDEFANADTVLPYHAVTAAINRKNEITPHLLEILRATIDDAEVALNGGMAHLIALYLLAQFREKSAYPLVVELIRHPEIDGLLGDVVTEHLPQIMASICAGDIEGVMQVIEDEDANEWVRGSLFSTLEILYGKGVLTREALLNRHRHLYTTLKREENEVWEFLIQSSTYLHFTELRPEIAQAFADNLTSLVLIDETEVEEIFEKDAQKVFKEIIMRDVEAGYIDDAISNLETWYVDSDFGGEFEDDPFAEDFTDDDWVKKLGLPPIPSMPPLPKIEQTFIRTEEKVGRNDPCPCGSGKKYKHCHGKAGGRNA